MRVSLLLAVLLAGALLGASAFEGDLTSTGVMAEKILFEGSPYLAKCLDGTSAGVYFLKAADGNNNWIISLEGGGECVDEASCKQRATTTLGSSKDWPAKRGLWGIQKQDPKVNPDFAGWNQLFVPYCSGDLFMGQDKGPSERAWGLQFSGQLVVRAAIELALEKLGMDKAQNVIYSGESAGGLGAVATADFVRALLTKSGSNIKFALVPVGGSYFNMNRIYQPKNPADPPAVGFIPWGFDAMQKYYTLWNAYVPEKCAIATPDAPWECMFFVKSYETMESDVFVIEAQTDSTVMPLHAGLPPLWSGSERPRCNLTTTSCPEVMLDYMQWWSQGMQAAVKPLIDQTKSKKDGIFFPACLIHTAFFGAKPTIQGTGAYAALGEWFFGRGPQGKPVFYVDQCQPGLKTGIFCGDCPKP